MRDKGGRRCVGGSGCGTSKHRWETSLSWRGQTNARGPQEISPPTAVVRRHFPLSSLVQSALAGE